MVCAPGSNKLRLLFRSYLALVSGLKQDLEDNFLPHMPRHVQLVNIAPSKRMRLGKGFGVTHASSLSPGTSGVPFILPTLHRVHPIPSGLVFGNFSTLRSIIIIEVP
jgi:hypothetical protein